MSKLEAIKWHFKAGGISTYQIQKSLKPQLGN